MSVMSVQEFYGTGKGGKAVKRKLGFHSPSPQAGVSDAITYDRRWQAKQYKLTPRKINQELLRLEEEEEDEDGTSEDSLSDPDESDGDDDNGNVDVESAAAAIAVPGMGAGFFSGGGMLCLGCVELLSVGGHSLLWMLGR